MTKKELLNAKYEWNCEKTFDYIYIIPTMRKHDSGYRQMEIIGCIVNKDKKEYIKLSTYSDVVDISNCFGKNEIHEISIDVEPENNCIRLFSRYGKLKPIFQVSSCTFKCVREETI